MFITCKTAQGLTTPKVAIYKNDLEQNVTRFHKHRYNGKQYKFLYSQNDDFSLGETGDWSCHVFTLNAAKRPVYIVSNASIYQRTVDGTVEMLTCGANQRECDADCGKQGICCEHKITLVKSCRCER